MAWHSICGSLISKSLASVGLHLGPSFANQLRTSAGVQDIMKMVQDSLQTSLSPDICSSTRLHLVHGRRVNSITDNMSASVQQYLKVPNARPRKALFRLLTSSHKLAVELLRYSGRDHRARLPRACRVCRFCIPQVEDEEHALFHCTYAPLKKLRSSFLADAAEIRGVDTILYPTIPMFASSSQQCLLNRFAAYTAAVCDTYEDFEMVYFPFFT